MYRLAAILGLCLILAGVHNTSALVISEIMPDPAEGDEWVELFNNSGIFSEIAGLKIQDSGENSCTLRANSPVLPPYTYCIVAQDQETIDLLNLTPTIPCIIQSNLPGLNNDGDGLTIISTEGSVLDSMRYESARDGISLERVIDPENHQVSERWQFCLNPTGHTAGTANSRAQDISYSNIRITASPNPFEPAGTGSENSTEISVSPLPNTAKITIRIFDSGNHPVRRLIYNHPVTEPSVYVWDGKNDLGDLVKMGR